MSAESYIFTYKSKTETYFTHLIQSLMCCNRFFKKCYISLLIGIAGKSILLASPLISSFNKQEYNAAMQNWGIAVDYRGIVYVANNDGLLEYDGTSWLLHPLPNKTIVRSLMLDSNRIYVGSYEEFGYFEEDKTGQKQYFSLTSLFDENAIQKNEIWRIARCNKKLYFQSFSKIFIIEKNKSKIIDPASSLVLLQKAREKLFIHVTRKGLCEIIGDSVVPIPGGDLFKNDEIHLVLPFGSNGYLLGSTSGGLFIYDKGEIKKWNILVNNQLSKSQINNGYFENGNYYIGTIVDGIYIIDANGNLLDHLYTGNGLNNNTILGIAPNKKGSIWLALDRGINFLDFKSPIELYIDKEGETGATYSALYDDNCIYLGTNKGVQLFKNTADGRFKNFGLFEGTQGQVWELKKINNQILCGHTDGTFQILKQAAEKISNSKGGFSTRLLPYNNSLLVQSTYSGFSIYEFQQGKWTFLRDLGMNETLPGMELDHQGNAWVNPTFKGTYKVTFDKKLNQIVKRSYYGIKKGFPSEYHIRVSVIDQRIVFATGQGVYTYDDLNDTIIPHVKLNEKLGIFADANKIVSANNDFYWFILNDEAALFEISQDKIKFIYKLDLARLGLGFAPQYPNIVPLNDSLHLFCLENGFALFNTNKLCSSSAQNRLLIRSIQISTASNNKKYLELNIPQKPIEIPYKYNNLSITVALLSGHIHSSKYAYKIEGLDEKWSKWENNPTISINRIQTGNYKLRIKAEDVNGIQTEIVYPFVILPPWYRSMIAYIFYLLVIVAAAIAIRMLFKYRLKQYQQKMVAEEQEKLLKERMFSEKKYMELENEKLDSEVAHKAVQLANTTMSLIKKNELLNELQNEIEKQKEELGARYPNKLYDRIHKLIEKDLNNEDYWNTFQAHFDQAHQDFFKRLKSNYPDLTPNDLKLCAYLKLNLSTKEIAQLLNLSIRGIEVHRYRLRKRLALETDQNLVEFLMNY